MAIAKLSIDIEARLANIGQEMAKVSKLAEDAAGRIKSAFGGLTLVFTGLAGAMSVGALKGVFDKYAEGAATLEHMGQVVGSTAEKLSGLAAVARINGTDIGALEASMVRLAASLSKADNEAKGAGKAFSLLGLDPEKLQVMDSADALQALAEKFAEIEDGSAKTALAVAIFGKAGAQMLPFLKDLADTGGIVAKVTNEQAAAAEEYEKNLKRLAAAQGAVAKIISAELLPAANVFVKSMVEMIQGSDGVRESVKGLAKDGSLKEWGLEAARAAAFVVDSFDGVVRVVKITGAGVAAMAAAGVAAAKGNLAGAGEILESFKIDATTIATRKQFSDILNDNIAKLNATGDAAVKAKRKIKFDNATPEAGSATKDKNRNFQDFDAILTERIAKAIENTDIVKTAELVRELEKLDEIAATGLDPAIVKAIRDDLTGATKDANEALARLNDLLKDTPTAKLQELQGDMRFLTEALENGVISEQQYLEAVQARLDSTAKKAKESGDEIDEFAKRAAQNMQDAMADFLFDPFQKGVGGMLQSFGTLIQKMIAQAVAANIGKRLFGDLVKGGEGKGFLGGALDWLGGLFKNADGGVYASPGLSAYSGSIVSHPTVFPFARGIGLMGEAGPEAILPLKRGGDGKLGVAAGAGHAINIHINMGADGDPAKVRRAAAAGAREALAVINGAHRYG